MHFFAICLSLWPAAPLEEPASEGSVFDILGEQARATGDIFDVLAEDKMSIQATKTDKHASEAPAILTIITRAQIQAYGYTSLADVLRHVVGFYVTDDDILPNVAVRGVSSGLDGESGIIKVMIDGQSTAFRSTGGNWLGPELIPMSAIERIEIIRGPASALYGADAFLGVINIVTRSGESVHGLTFRGAGGWVGHQPAADIDATLGDRKGAVEYRLSARVEHEDRSGLPLPSTSPAPNIPDWHRGALVGQGLVLDSYVADANLVYHLSDKSSLTAFGYYSSINRGGDFAPTAQLTYGRDSQGRLNQTLISLAQGRYGVKGSLAATSTVTINFAAQGFVGGPTGSDEIDTGNDLYDIRRKFAYIGAEASLEVSWHVLASLGIVAGASFMVDHESLPFAERILKADLGTLHAGDVLDATTPVLPNKDFINPGAYLQGFWTAIDNRLDLVAGLRYDYHNIYGNQLSPRAGGVVTLLDSLHVKLLYGGAFKAPSPLLLYAVPSQVGDIIGNPNLKPQYVHTFESEVSYAPLKYLTLASSVSYNLLLNQAEFMLQYDNQAAHNVATVRALSWESRVQASYEEWVRGYVSFELNHTTQESGDVGYASDLVGFQNTIYPLYQLHAGATAKLGSFGLASVEATIVGPRRASGANILAAGASYTLPAYCWLSASVQSPAFRIFGDHDTLLRLTGQNLLGVVGPDAGFSGIDYPLPPRSFFLSIVQEL